MKFLAVFLGLVACAAATPDDEIFYAKCQLRSTTKGDRVYGSVDLRQVGTNGNTEVKLSLSGFNFETDDDIIFHGFHIHELGDLSGGNCAAIESHYNPLGVDHGAPSNNAFSRHVGDLGNLKEDDPDTITTTFSDYLVQVQGDYSVIGRGMAVHAHYDDLGLSGVYDTLTTGNAGKRVACCVIGISDGRAWE